MWNDHAEFAEADCRYPLDPVRTIAPTLALWTLDEVKQRLRVDHNDEDGSIQNMLDEATQRLDGWSGILGRCLLPQTWRQDLHCFPWQGRVRLPLVPVTAVSGVTYFDVSNVSQTLATSVYTGPFTDARGAYLKLQFGQTWPVTYPRDDAVSVTFAAGYASAALVPAPIRQAVMKMVADAYANRETAAIGDRADRIPVSVDVEADLAPFRASY